MPIANVRSLAVQRTPLRELNLNMLLGSPVLALPMQEGSGDYAYDISGYGNDGHLGGGVEAQKPSWHQLPSGLVYLHHDGSDDKTSLDPTIPDMDLTALGSFSVLHWVNPLASPYSWAIKGTGNWDNFTLGDATDRKIGFNFRGNGGVSLAVTDTTVRDNWVLSACVKDGKTIYLYVNEGLIGSDSSDALEDIAGASAFNLAWYLNNAYACECDIALFRVFDGAISPTFISDCYNREKHYFDIFNGNILARLDLLRSLAVLR